jgi:hypothetical protein
MLEFLKPPRRIVAVVGRRAVHLKPGELPARKTAAEWEQLAKPLRRKLLMRQIGYWSCVTAIALGMIVAGLKLLR